MLSRRTYDADDLVMLWVGGNDLFAYSGSREADATAFCPAPRRRPSRTR